MGSEYERGPDFLAHLEEQRARHGGVFPRRGGGVYVADPVIAKEVLGNSSGNFREHSDFFRTSAGVLGPRPVQQEIARAARKLLQQHATDAAGTLPGLVAGHLGGSSSWPDAGNRLLFAFNRPALIGEHPSPALLETAHAVVERAVLAGARDRYSWLSRARFRARTMRVLTAEIAARRADDAADPVDLLDVLARAATIGTTDRELAEVFISCLFAVTGSVGFLLGWALYLMGVSGPETQSAPPSWVVREALRLWPVAWLFLRTPARSHRLGPITVGPRDNVFVCGYLAHRDPEHWSDPHRFRPSRWASVSGHEAFIPFGWGPHACTGAAVATRTVETIIEILTSEHRIDVVATDSRPHVGAALAPPEFTLYLTRGGETNGEARERRA